MPWSWPVVFAGALVVGTLLSLALGYRRLGPPFTADSVQFWIAGVGGGLLVLLAATWIARAGELRPLVAATAGAVAGAAVTLGDYLRPGLVSGGPLEWMVNSKDFGFRISGVIPSPNALAALLLVPAMLLAAAVVFAPRRRLRVLALAGLVPIVPTLYVTYSRVVFVAAFGFAVIAAWRIRRWLGVVGPRRRARRRRRSPCRRTCSSGPRAWSKAASVNPSAVVLVASDQLRFAAWGAAVGMWRDEPLTGYGFRSYRVIGDRYGDTVLNSPHNEWLRFFAEQGTLGGLVGLAFVLAGLGRLARVPGWLGTGTLAGFLAFVLAASFNNPFLFIQVSLVAFTIVGTGLAWGRRWPGASKPADETPAAGSDPGPPLEAPAS